MLSRLPKLLHQNLTLGRRYFSTSKILEKDLSSEYNSKPSGILVHNPVEVGAINYMDNLHKNEFKGSNSELESRLCFRNVPNIEEYSNDHNLFVNAISKCGINALYLKDVADKNKFTEQQKLNPNQVYTRDSVIAIPWLPNCYIRGNMKQLIRKQESNIMENAFNNLGIIHEIGNIPINSELYLEGGDVIPFTYDNKRCLIIGYGTRTSEDTLYYLQKQLIPKFVDEIIGIKLIDWRMNLDGGFVILSDKYIVTHFDSIIISKCMKITENKVYNYDNGFNIWNFFRNDLNYQLINVTSNESIYDQACNSLVTSNNENDKSIIYYDLCKRIPSEYKDVNFVTVPGKELVKGKGGPRCMSRPIYV